MPYKGPLAWLVLGLGCWLCIPILLKTEKSFYEKKESRFSSPIISPSKILRLRSDGYGKGYFGAPRNGGRRHLGIDLATPIGQYIFASKSGRVIRASIDPGFGLYVELAHPDGLATYYAHLSHISTHEGDWVVQGQLIGLSGKTGNAKSRKISPHLHFEIRNKTKALNPLFGWMDPSLQFTY